jgi:hypothetical protein
VLSLHAFNFVVALRGHPKSQAAAKRKRRRRKIVHEI